MEGLLNGGFLLYLLYYITKLTVIFTLQELLATVIIPAVHEKIPS